MGTINNKPAGKVCQYNKVRIEVCRNCLGSGATLTFDPCPVCGGGGTVRKKLKIEITIEPNTTKSNPGPRP